MLNDLRVLDLSTELGLMCGQLLADMGAEVRQWVRPADAPRLTDDSHWQAYTLGKQIEVVEWTVEIERLKETLLGTDVLIDGEAEAFWQAAGLGEDALEAAYPGLVRVRISPFGATGPKADYAATDLICLAASGHLYLSGAADGPPLRISVPQAHAHAAADAAVAVLIALFERSRSGCGQTIDVAAQHSATLPLLARGLDAALGQPKAVRSAYGAQVGGVYLRNQFEAADGWVVVLQGILPPLAHFMERLMSWVVEEGEAGEAVLGRAWGETAAGMATGEISAEDWAPIEAGIARCVRRFTRAELMEIAVARRLLVAPVLDIDTVLDNAHLAERGFRVRDERLGHDRLGAFARFSRSPLPLSAASGASAADVREARGFELPAVAATGASADEALPLSGLKILDVFWVIAGPGATRMLADYGATVVHVESVSRLDMVRAVPPYIDGIAEPERAACHHSTNANKLNISLDLSTPEGRSVLADLVSWADVFTESFAPGVIERMGFGYEAVSAINPGIVMISSCLMGQTGPWSRYAGYGNSAAAVTGFHGLTGMPGEAPAGCYGPYTDFTSVRFNALAILLAVMEQRRSGTGQFVDMSQAEASLHFLAPVCHDYLRHGRLPGVAGNRDRRCVPHGVFPTVDEDRWIALAIRDDDDWARFCGIAGEFADVAALDAGARRAREDALEARLAEWCGVREAEEIEEFLQAGGVPAHVVADTEDLFQDPQLRHRGHFIRVEHRDFSGATVESTRLQFSRTRARAPARAPWFGVDNRAVLGGVLAYPRERIDALEAAGILR